MQRQEALRLALMDYGPSEDTDGFLEAMEDAGFVIVPREPTEEMLAAPVSFSNGDTGIEREANRLLFSAMVGQL